MRLRRWSLFVLLVSGYTVLLLILGSMLLALISREMIIDSTPSFFSILSDMFSNPEWWISGGIVASISVAIQAVFLNPLFDRNPPRGHAPADRTRYRHCLNVEKASTVEAGSLPALWLFKGTITVGGLP